LGIQITVSALMKQALKPGARKIGCKVMSDANAKETGVIFVAKNAFAQFERRSVNCWQEGDCIGHADFGISANASVGRAHNNTPKTRHLKQFILPSGYSTISR
jgi:hypothetical protein